MELLDATIGSQRPTEAFATFLQGGELGQIGTAGAATTAAALGGSRQLLRTSSARGSGDVHLIRPYALVVVFCFVLFPLEVLKGRHTKMKALAPAKPCLSEAAD